MNGERFSNFVGYLRWIPSVELCVESRWRMIEIDCWLEDLHSNLVTSTDKFWVRQLRRKAAAPISSRNLGSKPPSAELGAISLIPEIDQHLVVWSAAVILGGD